MNASLLSDEERCLEATASRSGGASEDSSRVRGVKNLRRSQSDLMMGSRLSTARTGSSLGTDTGQQGPAAVQEDHWCESLDCDRIFNPDSTDKCRKQRSFYVNDRNQLVFASKSWYAWCLSFFMGIAIALVAFLIQFSSTHLQSWRNIALQTMIDQGWDLWKVYSYFTGFNLACILVAGILTLVEPTAEADGVGEIKGYLNGVCMRRLFGAQTVLIKIAGAILGTAGCLVSGAEASMVHIGAGIASGITRGNKLRSFGGTFSSSIIGSFHNDRDRKDFVCAGAGAGMAAAFGAPVGGMLFALEGTASHWSHRLIWRIFTAAIAANIFLDIVRAGSLGGNITISGLLDLGKLDGASSDAVSAGTFDTPILFWEMGFFIVVGLLCGVCAAVFKIGYRGMSHLRAGHSPVLRLLEVVFLSLITSSVIFYLSWSRPQCRNSGTWTCANQERWGSWCGGPNDNATCAVTFGACSASEGCPVGGGECVNGTCVKGMSSCLNATSWECEGGGYHGRPCQPHASECEWQGGVCSAVGTSQQFGLRMGCDMGQYDEFASLFFARREWCVKKIVTQAAPHEPYTVFSMSVAAMVYLVLLIFTFGAPLPAGLFMPCIVIGSCVGRCVGQLVKQYVSSEIFAGSYAVAGAAAMLGGVQSTSIAMIVVIVESTSNAHFLIPIVVASSIARVTARLLAGEEGIYEMVMKRKKMGFLAFQAPWEMRLMTVGDIMTRPPTSMRVVESVGHIVDLLRECQHSGFPVVTGERGPGGAGLLEGMILRSQLRALLSLRFMPDEKGASSMACLWLQVTSEAGEEPPLDGNPELYMILDAKRYAGSSSCQGEKEWEWGMFLAEDRARVINLGPYMNCAPASVNEACSLEKAYQLFLSLGLRHLPVVNVGNRVVGMVTRSNLTQKAAQSAALRLYNYEELHIVKGKQGEFPRLRGDVQIQKQRDRVAASVSSLCGSVKVTGAEVCTWQMRLQSMLREMGLEV